VVASDAFFPFPDGVEEAVKHGATAFIQPGGSVRDPEVIAAADRLGVRWLLRFSTKEINRIHSYKGRDLGQTQRFLAATV
jgi:hypothetical protein